MWSLSEMQAKMKILQIFGVVFYLSVNDVSSYGMSRGENVIKFSNSAAEPNIDFSYLSKLHNKRYSGFGPRHILREANDLLNSYFKIGFLPSAESDNFIDSSAAWADTEADEIPRYTIRPVPKTKKLKKPQLPQMEHVERPAAAAAPAPLPAGEPEPSAQPAAVDKAAGLDPMPVKRPIIVVGRLRGSGFQEWRKRRKMNILPAHGVFSICNHNNINKK